MKKKTISLFLALALCLGLVVPVLAVYDTPTFKDVPHEFWGYTYIEQAAEKGWVKGMGGGKFEPNGQVTYAQFATMLTQAFFKDEVDAYGVTNPWYARFCNIAGEKGLFAGTEAENYQNAGAYANRQMSRYEMAQVVYNTLGKINAKMPSSKEVADQIDTTPDFFDIPSKYSIAVLTAKASGIISGMGGGRFEGDGTLTRAQTCVVLIKLDELAGTGDGIPVDPKPSVVTQCLTNGKPVTEDNVLELIMEYHNGKAPGTRAAEAGFVTYRDGGHYDAYTPEYYSHALGYYGIECAKLAFAFWDDLFGNLPAREVKNIGDIRPGDLLDYGNHWAIATTGAKIDEDSGFDSGLYYIMDVNGGPSGGIGWCLDHGMTHHIISSDPNDFRHIRAYTRYPD